MAVTRSVISLNHASGVPKDRVVNTLYWSTPGAITSADMDDISAAISDFYNLPGSNLNAIRGNVLSDSIAAAGHTITYYDALGAPPNLPIRQDDLIFASAPSLNGLPEEVAICLSFKGAPVAGTNTGPGPHLPARVRGRIFLGPCVAALNQATGPATSPRPALPVLEDVVELAQSHLMSLAVPTWSVFSPTNGTAVPIVSIWMDDAWDTQRRRGVEASTRVTFP